MSQQGMELVAEPAVEARPSEVEAVRAEEVSVPRRRPAEARGAWRRVANAVCVPVAAGVALAVHYALPDRGPVIQTSTYAGLLVTILALGVVAIAMRRVWPAGRAWASGRSPLLAGVLVTLTAWDLITGKLLLLPAMYF